MALTLNDDVRELLKKPQIARLATIGANGFPHITPLWFLFETDRDEIVIMADRTARKAKNLLSNPHGALQVGGDPLPAGQDGYTRGVLLQGEFAVEDDPGHAVTARITRHYLQGAAADHMLEMWKDDDIVVLRMSIQKVIQVAG